MISPVAWLERVDPGANRRVKGLRLITAFALAAMMGRMPGPSRGLADAASLGWLAAGFALWASVSEGRTTRAASSRDLVLLTGAAALGAAAMACLMPVLATRWLGAELILVSGAFLVAYLKRYGILGAGIGSQIYIGQLLAYGAGLNISDLPLIGVAGLIAAVSAVVPRVLSGPAEQPPPAPAAILPAQALRMGLQAAVAALAIVLLNDAVGLEKSGWAITACTYVIAGSASGTIDRVRRRVIGTVVGVPLGLACLPIALQAPLLLWAAAALAMVIYAMALPERYDIACAAYAFTLIVTLAARGETSTFVLAARAWETLIGGALGLTTAMLLLPIREPTAPDRSGGSGSR